MGPGYTQNRPGCCCLAFMFNVVTQGQTNFMLPMSQKKRRKHCHSHDPFSVLKWQHCKSISDHRVYGVVYMSFVYQTTNTDIMYCSQPPAHILEHASQLGEELHSGKLYYKSAV